MKKVVLTLLFLMGYQFVQAQLFSAERLTNLENFDKRRWSYGFFVGANAYDFKFDYDASYDNPVKNDVYVKENFGFNLGMIGNMRINEYMDLRLEPGLVFTGRTLSFNNFDNSADNPYEAHGRSRKINSSYIHVPLLIKFSTRRLNNFKPFVVGGLSASYNLSSNEKNADDNYGRIFRMKTYTYYWEVGFGIDFYLYYFKFTPSVRGVFAMNNELVPDNRSPSVYTDGIHRMASRGIFLNFTFQ